MRTNVDRGVRALNLSRAGDGSSEADFGSQTGVFTVGEGSLGLQAGPNVIVGDAGARERSQETKANPSGTGIETLERVMVSSHPFGCSYRILRREVPVPADPVDSDYAIRVLCVNTQGRPG